jgi:hypothetical protein
MYETFQWSLYSNLLKRFSGLYMGTNTYVSEYMFGATRGSLPAALAAARSILVQNLPQGQAGETFVLPSGAGATAFEQQWLCGGAAAEAAPQKVTLLISLKF